MTTAAQIIALCEIATNLQEGNIINFAVATSDAMKAYIKYCNVRLEKKSVVSETISLVEHHHLVELLEEISPVLRKSGAVIAGGFVSAFINWDPLRAPSDCDVWLPRGSSIDSFIGWERMKSYDLSSTVNMSPDVYRVTEYKKEGFPITIQVLNTMIDDIYTVIDRFDFDVSKGIISPGLLPDGSMVGIRATKPEIVKVIKEGVTTYCEHTWDLDQGGKLCNKSLNRFRRYQNKGYKIIVSPLSRFTIEQIETMLEKQTPHQRDGSFSFYYEEDYETIPYNTLAYDIDTAYRYATKVGDRAYEHESDVFRVIFRLGINYYQQATKFNDLPTEFMTYKQLIKRASEAKEAPLLRVFW